MSANGVLVPYEDESDPDMLVKKFMRRLRAITYYIWQKHDQQEELYKGTPTKVEKLVIRRAVSSHLLFVPSPGMRAEYLDRQRTSRSWK